MGVGLVSYFQDAIVDFFIGTTFLFEVLVVRSRFYVARFP